MRRTRLLWWNGSPFILSVSQTSAGFCAFPIGSMIFLSGRIAYIIGVAQEIGGALTPLCEHASGVRASFASRATTRTSGRPVRATRQAAAGQPMTATRSGDTIEATQKLAGCIIHARLCRQEPFRPQMKNGEASSSTKRRRIFGAIKHELRRQRTPIGHGKTDGDLSRCHHKGRDDDAATVVLTAVGYNLQILLTWLKMLLCLSLIALGTHLPSKRD